MSKTPRTDHEEYSVETAANYGISAEQVVSVEFARQLETELASALAEIQRLTNITQQSADARVADLTDQLQRAERDLAHTRELLAKATAQRIETDRELLKAGQDLAWVRKRLANVTALNKPTVYRAFIDQPSSTQPFHHHHGEHGVAVDYDGGELRFYPLVGTSTSYIAPRSAVSRITP